MLLTTIEVVASLNEGLATPITRQVFERAIRPLMAADGDAIKHGGTWLYDTRQLCQWRVYLQGRQTLVAQGVWSEKRPYSLGDRDAVAHDLIQEI